ncbi:MAG: DUF6062 family protein [Bacteroidota bacterium]
MHSRSRHVGWDEYIVEGFLSFLSRFGNDRKEISGPRKKFLGYNDLLELFKKPQCPVCQIIKRSLNHYTATAFTEEVANGEFREEMRSTLGYCRSHSKYVLNILPRPLHGMGIAIVYEDLLTQVEMNLTKEPFDTIPIQNNCALCSFESELTDYALQLIADYCNDAEFQKAYANSHGLCFPHMRPLCERLSGEGLTFILEEHDRKLSTLVVHLSEFQRKNDHRFSEEGITPDEANAWQRAVKFMIGETG